MSGHAHSLDVECANLAQPLTDGNYSLCNKIVMCFIAVTGIVGSRYPDGLRFRYLPTRGHHRSLV